MNWTALIIMNNYFHDVATATLLSSAVILWVLGPPGRAGRPEDRARRSRKAMPTLTRFAIGALIWIILGGIPRVIFFNTFEFIPAKDNGIVVDLGDQARVPVRSRRSWRDHVASDGEGRATRDR